MTASIHEEVLLIRDPHPPMEGTQVMADSELLTKEMSEDPRQNKSNRIDSMALSDEKTSDMYYILEGEHPYHFTALRFLSTNPQFTESPTSLAGQRMHI